MTLRLGNTSHTALKAASLLGPMGWEHWGNVKKPVLGHPEGLLLYQQHGLQLKTGKQITNLKQVMVFPPGP